MSYNTTRTIKPLFWHLNQYCRTNGIAANGRNACTRRRHTNKHSWADGMAARDQNIPPKCSNFYEIVLYLHWALGGYVVCVFLGGRVWVANKYLLSSLFENANTTETPESLVTYEALLISNLWFTSFSVFLSCVGPGDILTSEKAKQLGNKYQWSANKIHFVCIHIESDFSPVWVFPIDCKIWILIHIFSPVWVWIGLH